MHAQHTTLRHHTVTHGASMATTRHYHDLLGLARGATQEAIRRQYRRLALAPHPDKNPQDVAAATARFQQLQLAVQTLCDTDSRAATTTVALTYTDVAARAKEEQGEKRKVKGGREEEEEEEQKESGGCVGVEEGLAETETERREKGEEEKMEEEEEKDDVATKAETAPAEGETDVQLTVIVRSPFKCAEHLDKLFACEQCRSRLTPREGGGRYRELRKHKEQLLVERRERVRQLNADRIKAEAEELPPRPRKIRFNLKDVPKPVKDREFLYRLYQKRKGGMVQQWRRRLAALNNSEAAWRQELDALAAERGWRAEGLEYTERSVQEEGWGAEAEDEDGEKGGRECLEGRGEEGEEERKEEKQGEEGKVDEEREENEHREEGKVDEESEKEQKKEREMEEKEEHEESGGCVGVGKGLAVTETDRSEEGEEEKKEEEKEKEEEKDDVATKAETAPAEVEADVQLTGTEGEPPYPLGWEEPVARLRCAEHLVYFSNCEECLSGMTAKERQIRLQERRDRISERHVERREQLQQLNADTIAADGKTKKRKGRRARRLQAKAEKELSRRPRKIRFNLKDVPKPVKDREFVYRLYQSRKGGMVQQWRRRLAALNNSEAAWRQELDALAAERGWRAEGLEYTERSVQEEEWGAEAEDEEREREEQVEERKENEKRKEKEEGEEGKMEEESEEKEQKEERVMEEHRRQQQQRQAGEGRRGRGAGRSCASFLSS
ncbi:trichohyalin-like [Eriocheir sinensis]|uniref:trichohyalin-like n=1 Tax=Eriocheir sinensis TaxID=95602 RepID=UPI0021CACFEF|nr:trichohyalin-like [Eriocheir sinensis]